MYFVNYPPSFLELKRRDEGTNRKIALVFNSNLALKICFHLEILFYFYSERAWLAQLVRSLPSDHKVPSSIPGSPEIWIFVWPSFHPSTAGKWVLWADLRWISVPSKRIQTVSSTFLALQKLEKSASSKGYYLTACLGRASFRTAVQTQTKKQVNLIRRNIKCTFFKIISPAIS